MGALVNGVFLIALCLSIFLEAIQRFVEPQEVTQPQIIFVVGCAGLVSNLMGLVLFHDHGHSHGESRNHPEQDSLSAAENGHASHDDAEVANFADESGNIADVLPQNVVGSWSGRTIKRSRRAHSTTDDPSKIPENNDVQHGTVSSSLGRQLSGPSISPDSRRRQGSTSHPRYSSLPEVPRPRNPFEIRNSVIARVSEFESDGEQDTIIAAAENTPLLLGGNQKDHNGSSGDSHKKGLPADSAEKGVLRNIGVFFNAIGQKLRNVVASPFSKNGEDKQHAKSHGHSHGHSHGDLNMRGVFLHVLGDALGNIGVIATALFIWFTDFSWRFYFDPAISLVITIIILCSAIPLCKAAARILLQAVPAGVSIDEIKEDIEKLPGVISCHHIHVWQLSDTKLVASLHVVLAFDFEGEGKQEFMRLTNAIRTCLREYGIRNPTIQPEFYLDDSRTHETDDPTLPKTNGDTKNGNSTNGPPGACVWESGARGETCCPAESRKL